MKKEQYKQILIRQAIPSGAKLIGKGFTFQQDNDSKHTAKVVKKYLKNKENEGVLENMEWPAQSPDLNPIENLWNVLNLETQERRPANENQLFDILEAAWQAIDVHKLKKLVLTMRRRCELVIENEGYPIKY